MHNVRIFKLICATFAAFLVALAAAYCCADDYAYRIAIAEAEQAIEAAGMTPHADPASPITAGRSEPAAKAATSRPSAPPVVIRAADHSAQASKKVAITPPRQAPSGPHWTHPADLRSHLMSGGAHQHTAAELRGLSVSEMEILHDRDHNAARAATSNCPNGRCPAPRRGILWRRR